MFAVEAAIATVNLLWTTWLGRRALTAHLRHGRAARRAPAGGHSLRRHHVGDVVLTFVVWAGESCSSSSAIRRTPRSRCTDPVRHGRGARDDPARSHGHPRGSARHASRWRRHGPHPVPLGRALRLVVLISLPLTAAGLSLGPLLLRLVYGEEYEGAGRVLRILLLAFPLAAAMAASGALISGLGRIVVPLGLAAVAAALNLGLDAALIPGRGAEAAAVANVISQAVGAALRHRVRVEGDRRRQPGASQAARRDRGVGRRGRSGLAGGDGARRLGRARARVGRRARRVHAARAGRAGAVAGRRELARGGGRRATAAAGRGALPPLGGPRAGLSPEGRRRCRVQPSSCALTVGGADRCGFSSCLASRRCRRAELPARCAVGLLRGLQGHGLDVKALAARQHGAACGDPPSRPTGRGAEGAARSGGLERAPAAAAETAGLAFPRRVRRARAPACPRRRRAPPGGDGNVLVRSRNRYPGASPRALPDPRGSGVPAPVGPRSAPLRGVRPGRACGDAPPSASRRELAPRRARSSGGGRRGLACSRCSLCLDPEAYAQASLEGPPTAGIIGTASWLPTQAAVLRLVEHVWPLVRRAVPDARLLVAGRGMSELMGSVDAPGCRCWARYRPPPLSFAASPCCSTRSSAAAG